MDLVTTAYMWDSYKTDMNLLLLKTLIRVKKLFRKKADMNAVIEENVNLMKEIRAKRIRVYRLYKQAQLHLKS